MQAWTFRNEARRLAADYGGNPAKEYLQFFGLGVDGVFADFPDTALAARARFVAEGGGKAALNCRLPDSVGCLSRERCPPAFGRATACKIMWRARTDKPREGEVNQRGGQRAPMPCSISLARYIAVSLANVRRRQIQMKDLTTITGIAGAVTGVIALFISIKNYVRVNALKALDLRLELQRSFNDLDVVLSGVEAYLDFVHQSHMRVLAATGRNQSGEMRLFEEEFAKDKTRLRGLLGTQPRREANYEKHTADELERLLVSVHAFQVQVADLRGKYQKLFQADEDRREEIRAEQW